MLKDSKAFGGFSVNSIEQVKSFYSDTLGLDTAEEYGMLRINLSTGGMVIAYPKEEAHQPATFTILNFPVDDIDKAVEDLSLQGVTFEVYDGMNQDEKGIARGKAADMGPDIAWFKDPASNILAILQN